jgi:hypothetical protein
MTQYQVYVLRKPWGIFNYPPQRLMIPPMRDVIQILPSQPISRVFLSGKQENRKEYE